jgi:HEAT repeat protein
MNTQAEEERYRALLALDLAGPRARDELLRALYDPSWRVRKAAAERFPRLSGGDEVAGALLRVLADREHTGARNAAAEALVHLGPRAVGPVVLVLTRHEDPDQRKFAADILGQLGAPEAAGPLLGALSDPDANVQAAAAEALGGIGGDDVVRGLEAAFGQGPELLRACALESLIRLGRPPALPSLAPLLDQPALRRAAYRALGLVPQPAAYELVARGLLSSFRSVRESALAALGLCWTHASQVQRSDLDAAVAAAARKLEDAAEVVRSALEGDDPEVKTGALVLAASLREQQPAPEVAEAARDDRQVAAATYALARLGPAAGRDLLGRLAGLSAPARAAAAEGLFGMADPSWVEPLTRLLDSGEPDLRRFAARALGRTGSPDALGPLLPLLEDAALGRIAAGAISLLGAIFPDQVLPPLRARVQARPAPAAVSALGKVGGPSALPALKRCLRDPDPAVRAAAAEAVCEVGEVGGDECLELARFALTDEAPAVRAAVARALGRLQGAAEELIRIGLSDPDRSVQMAATEAAGESGVRAVAPLLGLLVASDDGLRASRAVRALARLGALSPAHLRAAGAHADPEVVKEALSSGAALAEAVPLAASLLQHRRWDVRLAAARVLEASGTREALDAVQGALAVEAEAMVRTALAGARSQLLRR